MLDVYLYLFSFVFEDIVYMIIYQRYIKLC